MSVRRQQLLKGLLLLLNLQEFMKRSTLWKQIPMSGSSRHQRHVKQLAAHASVGIQDVEQSWQLVTTNMNEAAAHPPLVLPYLHSQLLCLPWAACCFKQLRLHP